MPLARAKKVPEVHNPAKLWDDEIARKQHEVKEPVSINAPSDVVKDFRREPEWLIPEIRSWKSLHYKTREAKVRWLLSLDEGAYQVNPGFRFKCLRWLLSQEPDRKLAKLMFEAIWPDANETK